MRYRVEGGQIMTDLGEVLLAGPLPEMIQIITVLNAADPPEDRLAATVRACIGMTRDCSFAPGERLLNDGSPMIDLRGKRRC